MLTPFSAIQPNNTTGVVISTTPNNTIEGIEIFNVGAAGAFIKLYNLDTVPTASDTPLLRYYIPADTGFAISLGRIAGFNKGVSYRVTAGIADNNNVAVPANEVIINIYE